jgi:disulfide oxidoreductase YuzD
MFVPNKKKRKEEKMDLQLDELQFKQKRIDAHQNAKNRAKEKLMERYYTRYYSLQLQHGLCEDEFLTEAYTKCKEMEDIEKQRLDTLAEEKGYKDKTEYTFVTVNPKDDVPLDTLISTVEKSIEKTSWIRESEYAYVIEQRSTNPSNYFGWHAHLLVKTGDKPLNEIRRELKSKFKSIVDMDIVKGFDKGLNKKGPLSIEPTLHFENRMKYILDWKKDPDKHAKQIVDKEMRTQFNIPPIVYNGELFSNYIIGHQECQESTLDP